MPRALVPWPTALWPRNFAASRRAWLSGADFSQWWLRFSLAIPLFGLDYAALLVGVIDCLRRNYRLSFRANAL
jgi:hypothetical protein